MLTGFVRSLGFTRIAMHCSVPRLLPAFLSQRIVMYGFYEVEVLEQYLAIRACSLLAG